MIVHASRLTGEHTITWASHKHSAYSKLMSSQTHRRIQRARARARHLRRR